jgi:multidrug efflux pump
MRDQLPLVFVTGAGAAARNNIGVVLVAGMTIGTLFTLFVIPSIYILFASPKAINQKQPERHGA